MNNKKIILICLTLWIILTIGAVSAQEINNADNPLNTQDNINTNIDKIEITDQEIYGDGISINLNDGDIFEIGNDEENYIDVEIDSEEDITGKLSVKLNGSAASLEYNTEKDHFYILNDGRGKIGLIDDDHEPYLCLDNLTPGNYNIEINFQGPSPAFSITKTATITVIKPKIITDITITVEEEAYIQGQSQNMINITLPANIIDNVNIKINNTPYTFRKLSNTQGYVDISQLTEGKYEIIVSGGNLTKNATFEVINPTTIPGIIQYPKQSIECGSNNYISLTLAPNAQGNLVIMNGSSPVFNQSLVNGFASYSLSGLKVGYYFLVAYYTGADFDVKKELIVFNILPKITLPSNMSAGENKFLIIDFIHDFKGTVNISANYELYESINVNGRRINVSLAELNDGEVDLYIEYVDDKGFYYVDYYEILVFEVQPKLIGGQDMEIIYGGNDTYNLTIYGTNAKLAQENEFVEITIGKKVFDAYIGENGTLQFKIPKSVVPGKYTLTVDYYGFEVSNSLVINHLVKLSKVKVRKSARKLILKASLLKGMNGKSIVFKFNGKKFKAKTNANGVAKVIVKKSILNKLGVGKKIKYQATYEKDTVIKKVKVSR
ncbi:MAG: Ig-like domain repeat protein [Methanobrevibacter thaueri]|nr:Ig-like domain repeat protein [Methanobrevibacter thaueri]